LVQSETLLNNIFLKDFRQEMSFVQDDKRLSFEQTKAAEAFVFFCLSHSIPHICHGRHGRHPCKFFLAGVNFYRFNAKNLHFRQILREKVAFFLQI